MGHAGLVQSFYLILFCNKVLNWRRRGSWGPETIGHWTMFEFQFLLMQEASFEYLVYEIGIIPMTFLVLVILSGSSDYDFLMLVQCWELCDGILGVASLILNGEEA